jgi:hypothetical protein
MQMILGRENGPSAQYVALKSNTVSRRHARFAFSNGQWAVANLSQTNPVVINDEELTHSDEARDLATATVSSWVKWSFVSARGK